MDSLSPSDREIGTGSVPSEKERSVEESNAISAEHSFQKKGGDESDGKNLAVDSSSNLSVTAEPFKTTSLDQSSATQLSVFAKEFVPKAAVYTESYGVQLILKSSS